GPHAARAGGGPFAHRQGRTAPRRAAGPPRLTRPRGLTLGVDAGPRGRTYRGHVEDDNSLAQRARRADPLFVDAAIALALFALTLLEMSTSSCGRSVGD